MEKVVATGVQDFEKLRVHQRFYVDKTDFIRKWWKGRDAVTLITRPRRFGKTLNMSTLNCFFSNKYENRGELFEGLKVWEDAEMREQQGKWPVIFLSFAGIKGTTYEDMMIQMKKALMKKIERSTSTTSGTGGFYLYELSKNYNAYGYVIDEATMVRTSEFFVE